MTRINYYRVNASYRETTNNVIGCGVVCDTYDEAIKWQNKYISDPRVKCVDIEKVTLGG